MAPADLCDMMSRESAGPTKSAFIQRSDRHIYPKVTHASGNWITLDHVRRIFDAAGGASVADLGHNHEQVTEGMIQQIRSTICYVHDHSFRTDIGDAFAEALVESTGGLMTRVWICSSGSGSGEAAMKLGRQYFVERNEWSRTKFIARKQSYHGATLGTLSLSGHLARRRIYEPLLSDRVSHVSPCNPFRGLAEGESIEYYVKRLADELRAEFRRVGPNEVIGFIAEPVVGAALGCVPAVPGYLRAMKDVCDEFGALLILDEVMCGMGRCGTMHAWEDEGVVPDIQMIGKGLGGGYQAVAGILANPRVVDVIQQGTSEFVHGHTYQGHPLACAAGLAVHNAIKEENLIDNVRKMGDLMSGKLKARLASHPHVGDIRGKGLFWGIEFVKDKLTKESFHPDLRVAKRIHDKGRTSPYDIFIYWGTGSGDNGVEGDHLLLSPAYNINEDDVDYIVDHTTQLVEDFFSELDASST